MRAYERFLKYVKVHTTSDPANVGCLPSSERQFDLARMLVEEMEAMGIQDARVDEQCYVYGSLPATAGCEDAPALGFIAHMDTSPDSSGEGVKPILHHNYDGKDVRLPNGRIIDVKTFPRLGDLKGQTLITASGDTLLGGDDKAGIAEILTACERLIQENIPHGKLCIGFTPDEEIGAGADGFDVPTFGAKYAYTVDGGEAGEIEYETFNAAGAKVTLYGTSVHPGSAKNIMVNANKMAMEFSAMLPQEECPEKTEDREGFYHLCNMSGSVEKAVLEYIIRDHDRKIFEERKAKMEEAVQEIRKCYGKDSVELSIEDSYYNMAKVIEENFHLVENAREAIREAGLNPITIPVRGGTDGSRLSYMGLPCPNLGTGGFYCHGPNECVTVEGMDKATEIVLNIIKLYAREKA